MKECEFYPTGSENLNRLKKGSGQFYSLVISLWLLWGLESIFFFLKARIVKKTTAVVQIRDDVGINLND